MLLPRLQVLLLAANSALAFKYTSPFLLLSSDPLSKDASLQSAQVGLTKDVEDQLIDTLSACDKEAYYIFSQEHVRADDFRNGAMPKLQQRVADMDKGRVVQIQEVISMGQLSGLSVASRLEEACSSKGKKQAEYTIVFRELPALPSGDDARVHAISENDAIMDSYVPERESSSVLIYITTPASSPVETKHRPAFEMDDSYPSEPHMDLKRNVDARKRQEDGNSTLQAGLPLFETYQFLSPALFMTLGVSVLLLGILYVGVSAIAGLEVSYAAFSKEMGPQAQKGGKQQ